MKILVIASTPPELKAIKEGIKSANLKKNLNIDFLCCGIGNYETISSLEQYITKSTEPIFIRNIGVCRYKIKKNQRKIEPIQITNIINIHTGKELIIPPYLQIATLKTCFNSENITTAEKLNLQKKNGRNDNEMYFDMESRGIEFTASRHNIPHLILKIPFDSIENNEDIEKEKHKDLQDKIANILKNLQYQDYLKKIIKRINQQNKN